MTTTAKKRPAWSGRVSTPYTKGARVISIRPGDKFAVTNLIRRAHFLREKGFARLLARKPASGIFNLATVTNSLWSTHDKHGVANMVIMYNVL
jgi:hypothetical protein